ARTPRAALVASRPGRQGPQAELGFRAEAGRRDDEIAARRRAVARPGSPPRGRRDDDADRAGRGSRASSGPREPSGGYDDPDRTVAHSPETGTPDRDDAARAAAPAEWCASAHRLRGSGHRDRVASPRGSRRTPDAGTFPQRRARRRRGPTGRAHPGPPAPARRRGPRPGSAHPGRRDRFRGGALFRRPGPARPPARLRRTGWAAPARPTPSSRASLSDAAPRVSARTFEYESSPRASARASRGRVPRARATRTRSRAAPRSSPTRHDSHSAH